MYVCMDTCSREMENLGWTSVVIQTREDSWMCSVSVRRSSSSSMKSRPRWQFWSSTHVPCGSIYIYTYFSVTKVITKFSGLQYTQ